MGGGTSSGGGSSSTDYPEYMKTSHEEALNSIWDLVSAEQGSDSPYAYWTSTDPNYVFGIPDYGWEPPASVLNRFKAGFPSNFSLISRYDPWKAQIDSSSYIGTYISTISAALGDRLDEEVYPRFEAGMRDIGAVVSSAFVIGRAVIENAQTRTIAKLTGDLTAAHQQIAMELAFKGAAQELEWGRQIVALTTEITRIYLAAKFELDTTTVEMSAKDRRWDMESFEYYNHVLAAISGAAIAKSESGKASALGGALSGAAAGALVGFSVGGPTGAAIGAAGGGLLGLFSSLF